MFATIEAELQRAAGVRKRSCSWSGARATRSRCRRRSSRSSTRSSAELDVRVLASSSGGGGDGPAVRARPPRSGRAPSTGPRFYALLPFRVARELQDFRPDAVLAQGAQEAALCVLGRTLARVATRVIADIHGDPAAPARLYGSPSAKGARAARRCARPLRAAPERRRADDLRLHLRPRARCRSRADRRVRGVHGPRAVPRVASPRRFRSARSLSSSACSSATRRSTCSPRPGAVAAPRVPDATLHLVGRGTLARRRSSARRASFRHRRAGRESLTTPEVARALDESTVLVLPSRSEGLGRVVVEAFCRGRGVVGAASAAFPTSSRTARPGILVPPDDADALADALVRVLSDSALAERLGAAARGGGRSPGSRRRRSTRGASASSSTRSTS